MLDARRDAERGVAAALRQAEDAEEAHSDAVRDAQRAQTGLTEARRDARRALEDLQFQQAGGAIAERRAVLRLKEATAELAAAQRQGLSGDALEEVRIGYDEAALSLDELRVRNNRLREDKAEADRAGVEGSRQVQAALDRIAQANERVADTDQARRDAHAAVVEAQRAGYERIAEAMANQARTAEQGRRSIESAQDGVASALRAVEQAAQRAGEAGVDGMAKVKEAMAELTPQGQEFVRFLDERARPAIKELKATAQSNLLPGLQAGIDAALQQGPLFNEVIGVMGRNIGELGRRAGEALNDPFWVNHFRFLRDEATPTTQTFGTIFGGTMQGLAGTAQGAVPIWRQMGDGLERMTLRFARFGAEAAAGRHEKFNDFLDYVERVGPKVVQFLGDVVGIAIDLGVALAPAGELIMDVVHGVSQFIDSIPPPVLQAIATGLWAVAAGFALLTPVRILVGGLGVAVAGLALGVVRLGTAIGSAGLVGLASRLAGVATFLGGPWGVAIGLGVTALGALAIANNHAGEATEKLEASNQAFYDALYQSKGAIDETVRSQVQAAIANQTLAHSGDQLVSATDRAGISQEQLNEAIIAGGPALDDIRAKLQATVDTHRSMGNGFELTADGVIGSLDAEGQAAADALLAIDGLSGGFRAQDEAALQARAAINGITVEQQKLRDATLLAHDALMASIGADISKEQTALRLESAQRRYNEQITQYGAGSLEARTAAADLEQTYLSMIESSATAAAKQAEANGVTDTTQIALDAANRKALELAATTEGPLPAALTRMIGHMSASELAANGVKLAVDDAGRAVYTMPDGKTITLSDNSAETIQHLKDVQTQLALIDATKRIELTFDAVAGKALQGLGLKPGGGSGGGIVRADSGGVIAGYAPGIDDVPALLSRGEGVLVPEAVRALGVDTILAINRMFSGRTGTIWRPGGSALPQFAGGGVIGAGRTAGRGGAAEAGAGPAGVPDVRAILAAVAAFGELLMVQQLTEAGLGRLAAASRAAQGAVVGLRGQGLDPLAVELARRTVPAVEAAAVATGQTAAAAVERLHDTLPPLQQQFATTGTVVSDVAGSNNAATEEWRARSWAAFDNFRAGLAATDQKLAGTAQVTADTAGRNNAAITDWQTRSEQAFGGLQVGLGQVDQAIVRTAEGTRDQFGAMRGYTADPVRYVIDRPMNAGLVAAWNKLNDTFALGKPVATLPGFAGGGPIRGAGTATSDDILARLSNGEFVVRTEIARRVPHFLEALNSGQAEALQAAGVADQFPGFAEGGLIADAQVARALAWARTQDSRRYQWGGSGNPGWDCSGFVAGVQNVLQGRPPNRRLYSTASFSPGRGAGGLAPGLLSRFGVGVSRNTGRGIGHMAATLDGVNLESRGGDGVVIGPGAAGARHTMFPMHFHLPQVGGKFVGGHGGGAGSGEDYSALIEAEFAEARRMAAQTTDLHRGVPAGQGRGVAEAGITGAVFTALNEIVQSMFAGVLNQARGGLGGVARWRGVVNRALALVGQPQTLADVVLRRMNQESGGNPNAVNNWDINARRGTPSVGLMQVIGPTFRAHAGQFRNTPPQLHGVSVDPLANIYASMRYTLSRYGSLPAGYNRRGGYDNGGPVPPGLNLLDNRSGKFEHVLNAEQGVALRDGIRMLGGSDGASLAQVAASLQEVAAAVRAARTIHVHPRPEQSEESIATKLRRIEEAEMRTSL